MLILWPCSCHGLPLNPLQFLAHYYNRRREQRPSAGEIESMIDVPSCCPVPSQGQLGSAFLVVLSRASIGPLAYILHSLYFLGRGNQESTRREMDETRDGVLSSLQRGGKGTRRISRIKTGIIHLLPSTGIPSGFVKYANLQSMG
jgi:hypothetical protein